MKLKELREKHRSISVEMRKLNDTLESEGRGLSDSEKSQWNAWSQERSTLEERIARAEQVSDVETNETREQIDRQRWEERRDSHIDDPNRPLTAADELRAFTAWGLGHNCHNQEDIELARRCGYNPRQSSIILNLDRGADVSGVSLPVPKTIDEARKQSCQRQERRCQEARRCADGLERRAQSVGTTTAGGHTVPNEMMMPLEQALLAWGNIRQYATVITTATGATLPIPTVNDTSNKGEIIAENNATNALDTTFGQVTLGSYKYSSKYILVSVELLQDSSVNLPVFIGNALGTRIGRITNDHFTTGTGSSQPQGVVTGAANSSITSASATSITYANLLSVFHSIDPAYRANATWMCNDTVKLVLHSLVDSQGRPMMIPSINGGEADTILGRPLAVNQSMASGAAAKGLIFGDLSSYYIREVKQIELMRLDELYASSHQVAFLAFARYDGKLINAGTNPVKYMTMGA